MFEVIFLSVLAAVLLIAAGVTFGEDAIVPGIIASILGVGCLAVAMLLAHAYRAGNMARAKDELEERNIYETVTVDSSRDGYCAILRTQDGDYIAVWLPDPPPPIFQWRNDVCEPFPSAEAFQ